MSSTIPRALLLIFPRDIPSLTSTVCGTCSVRNLVLSVLLMLFLPSKAVTCTVPQNAANLSHKLAQQINQTRMRHGLTVLTMSQELFLAAQQHACDNARHNRLSHTGTDGSNFGQRILRVNYSYRFAGENVALGYATPDATLQAWLQSAGHRRNVLSSHPDNLGLGVARGEDGRLHWVMLVGQR